MHPMARSRSTPASADRAHAAAQRALERAEADLRELGD
jgi:hypothetical protein